MTTKARLADGPECEDELAVFNQMREADQKLGAAKIAVRDAAAACAELLARVEALPAGIDEPARGDALRSIGRVRSRLVNVGAIIDGLTVVV